jgi:HEAT repeat protein
MSEVKDTVTQVLADLRSSARAKRRAAVQRATNYLGNGAELLPILISLLADVDLGVRQAAVKAVACWRQEAVKPLLELLAQGNADQQKAAIVTLGEIGPEARSARSTLQALKDDRWLGGAVRQALEKIGTGSDWADIYEHPVVQVSMVFWLAVLLWVGLSALGGIGQRALFESNNAGNLAATILGGLGALMGGIVGASRGKLWLATLPLVFGVAGVFAGVMMAGLLGTILEPLARILGRS